MKKTPKKIKAANAGSILKVISVIDYIYAGLFVFGAIILFIGGTAFSSLGFFHKMFFNFGGLFGGALIFISLIFLALAILYFYIGKSIMQLKSWAKNTQIIMAVLQLFSFPIGTIIGIFILWALLINKETKDLFH